MKKVVRIYAPSRPVDIRQISKLALQHCHVADTETVADCALTDGENFLYAFHNFETGVHFEAWGENDEGPMLEQIAKEFGVDIVEWKPEGKSDKRPAQSS
jgi:hypothetical protein